MSCNDTTYRVSVVQGASLSIDVVVKDADGALVDLTGASAYFTTRRRIDDVVRTIYKRSLLAGGSAAEIDVLDQVTYPGTYRILLVPDDTRTVRPDRYVWDTWIQLATGELYPTVTAAPFQITPAITRFL